MHIDVMDIEIDICRQRGASSVWYQHRPHGRGGVLGILDDLGLDPRHGALNDIPPLPGDCKEALNARQDHHLVSRFEISFGAVLV